MGKKKNEQSASCEIACVIQNNNSFKLNLVKCKMRYEFRYDNFDLPFLASEVAIDLSNHSQGRDTNTGAIEKLSKMLYELSRQEYIDMATESLLAESIGRENFKSVHPTELPYQVNLIARELENYLQLSNERLETLANSCVDLSKTFAGDQMDLLKRRLAA